MPERLLNLIQPLREKWDALEKRQKIQLVAAVLVVVLSLAITIFFVVRTKYVLLVQKRTYTEIKTIENTLIEAGIKYKITDNNTAIKVDETRIMDAQVELDTKNVLEGTNFTYADALNASGMTATEAIKNKNMIQSKQTELENQLKGFEIVNSAKVTLHIPNSSRFLINSDEKSTASVTVDASRTLNRNEGAAIARLICRAVEGLEMENIEVYDSYMNPIYSGLQETVGGGYGSITEMQELEKRQIINQLRAMLIPIGNNDVQVVPNLIYNNDNSVTRTQTLRPPVSGNDSGVPIQESLSNRSVSGSPTANEPGLGANDQQAPDYQTGNNTTYDAKEKESDITYDYDRQEIVTESNPGSYIRGQSSITVTLYRYEPHYRELLIQQDKNFSRADWEAYKKNTKETPVAENDPRLLEYVNIITNATGINRENVTVSMWEVPEFVDYTKPPVQIQQIIMFAVLALLILLLAFGLIRRAQPEEEEEEIEPELSVEDLLVSTQLEEAKEEALKEADMLDEIDYFKDSEIKKQIEKFVDEKPEAVAQLLRNWLNSEDW